MDIEPHRKSKLFVLSSDADRRALYDESRGHLANLANITDVSFAENRDEVEEDVISVVVEKAELFLPMKDLVDYAKEAERLEREVEKTQSEIERAEKKLANENFVNKAKAEVVEAEREKLATYTENLANLNERLHFVKERL